MTTLRREDDGWLLIGVLNISYDPVIDLNSEDFKQLETPIKFGKIIIIITVSCYS